MEMNKAREADAKALSDFYSGKSDNHPHGTLARNKLLPIDLSSDCSDTSVQGYGCSEWGRAAGMV